MRVTLREGLPSGPVELVLKSFENVPGRVLSSTGPAAGARVHVATLTRAVPAVDSAVTDSEGRFTLRLPEDAGLLGVVVLPPGGFLTTATALGDGSLELKAAERGGTLSVHAEEGTPGRDFHLFVLREGVFVHQGLLDEWSRGHGVHLDGTATVRFPKMGEGNYRVCLHGEQARQETIRQGGSWQDVVAGASRCADGFLPAGGELSLTPGSE